jgi:hypothetical protein
MAKFLGSHFSAKSTAFLHHVGFAYRFHGIELSLPATGFEGVGCRQDFIPHSFF